MIKQEITFNDLDENPVTETFWFHLSKGEMAEMAIGKEGAKGGFETWVKTLIASNDGEVLIKAFREILLSTIGERAPDNIQFIKSDQIRNRFAQSDAYSTLLMDLLTDADKMSAFINGVVPAKMRDGTDAQMKAILEKTGADAGAPTADDPKVVSAPTLNGSSEAKDERPDWLKEGRVPTETELKGAKPEYIMEAFRLRSASGSN